MRYTNSNPTKAKNADRRSTVFRMSKQHYEKKARDLNTNALDAANFEVAYYKQHTHGKACTCIQALDANAVLDDNGNLTDDSMDILLDSRVSSYDLKPTTTSKSRFSGVSDYSSPTEIGETPEQIASEFDDGEIDFDIVEGDLNVRSIFDSIGSRGFTAAITNCPVCNRTGFVGGYSLFGGVRTVLDVRSFYGLKNCSIDVDASPYQIVPTDTEQSYSFRFSASLPKHLKALKALRLMESYEPASVIEYSLFRSLLPRSENSNPDDSDFIAYGLPNYKQLPNGLEYVWRVDINPTVEEVTHFEILGVIHAKLLNVDISNFNRSQSGKSFNDVDPISLTLPATLGEVRVRDIFYDKASRTSWIITSVEKYTSSHTTHGFAATAERIRSSNEPYSLYNPYSFGYREKITGQ